MPHLSIALIGPVEVALDGAPVRPFDYAKVRALLAYLAAERQREHTRDALAELLWPEQSGLAGRNSLRRALASLRQTIGDAQAEPPFLLATRETVQFNPRSDHALDTASFAELIAACEHHAHTDAAGCLVCAERRAAAVRLYRGAFLDGALPRDCPELEAWASARREWFEQQILAALTMLAKHHAGRGEHDLALSYARRQLDLDPWREGAHRQTMRALAALGQRSAAIGQYEQCRRRLQADLGVAPEPETSALFERIRSGDLGRAANPAPAPADPPSPAAKLEQRHLQATSLIGRDADLDELAALLGEPGCRMLTLLGPGGIGKTRLARALAERVARRFAYGFTWVPLATLAGPSELIGALAEALGCSLDQAADPRAALFAFLSARETLLLLDNFEHLVDGAALLADLLSYAPQVKLLVTSRERLYLQPEWLYDVAGLLYPSDEDGVGALDTPAMQLLLARARQVRRPQLIGAELRAAARIARLVEGMPLALELAAAASRERPFAAVADALVRSFDLLDVAFRDLPERHRSMRAALDHSWRLLDGPAQLLLAQLSVFRGGFTAAAAAAVASADAGALGALADKSLLRAAAQRYEIHELIRQFAAEQLAALGLAAEAHRAHLAYLAGLAERSEPELLGEQQQRWLAELEREHDNIRAALRWSIDTGELEDGARVAAALWRFWWMRGHLREGRRWLDELLDHPTGIAPATRARAAKGAGSLANQQGDYARAQHYHSQSLALQRELGNQFGVANALGSLARALRNLGDFAQSRALQEQGLVILRELGNERGVSLALDGLAELAFSESDYARARDLYAQSLALHRKRNDRHSIAIANFNLSEIAAIQGDLAGAAEGARAGLALFRELGNTNGIVAALHLLGYVARRRGHLAASRAHYLESLVILQRQGQPAALVSALVGLADLAAAQGQAERALRLCAAAEGLRAQARASFSQIDQAGFAQALAAARSALTPAAYASAWAAGQALTAEQALAAALVE